MSGYKRIKTHHYIPKALLKHFTVNNDEKSIWYSDKSIDTGNFRKPELRNINSVFRVKNLYTVIVNGKPSDIVERNHYGSIDNYLGVVLPLIIDALNKGDIPDLSSESLNDMRRTVIEMFKRTPHFGSEQTPEQVGRRAISEILNENIKTLTDQEVMVLKNNLEDKRYLIEIGRSIITNAKIKKMPLVEGALDKYSIRWVETESKHSFILSSICCYRIGNGGPNGLGNANTEVWMPISPRYCMVMLQDPFGMIPLRVSIDQKKTREVNEFAAMYSGSVASHSKSLIESLTRQKAK
ncbi:DUF4238 domain-containing protein [Brucella pseudogrignonensis]|uniref:DUF4238 domain-containing protein n=1 Tax=Brucella pseudogrignonensis TaxID=419475 RepID=UPI00148C35DE|nr:DUF4238 domain-containing protein [Brucella pseudogrignonensis]